MLELALLVFFGVMAFRIANAVSRETVIFREFHQPRTLLFSLGPLIVLAGLNRVGLVVSTIAGAMCYLPALLNARRLMHAFDTAGTDRVRRAHSTASQAFGTVLAGLLYIAGAFGFAFIAWRYSGGGSA